MAEIVDILSLIEAEWHEPRFSKTEATSLSSLRMQCTLYRGSPITSQRHLRPSLPDDLIDLWSLINNAILFEDIDYGQWGLKVLSPKEAIEATGDFMQNRPKEYSIGDLIIGTFVGDQDLLLVRCDRGAPDFGQMLVVLPLDQREDWWNAANTLSEMLSKYVTNEGSKYWE